MTSNDRFAGRFGEDYELFKLACPHYDKVEQHVSDLAALRIWKSKNKLIFHPGELNLSNPVSIKSTKILDIGCGTGITTQNFMVSLERVLGAEAFNYSIVAIDKSETMINQARKIIQDTKMKVEFIETDALDYLQKANTGSFAAIISCFTLHNFKKSYRDKVHKEIYRLLDYAGAFVNGDKIAKNDKYEHKADLESQLNLIKKVYRRIGRDDLAQQWIKHYIEDNQPDIQMNESETLSTLKNIGFMHVNVEYRKRLEAVIIAKKYTF